MVLNSPGTIDSDYRNEVCILPVNLEQKDIIINGSDRTCQMVIARHEMAEWTEVEWLELTGRDSGGFGHTGKK